MLMWCTVLKAGRDEYFMADPLKTLFEKTIPEFGTGQFLLSDMKRQMFNTILHLNRFPMRQSWLLIRKIHIFMEKM